MLYLSYPGKIKRLRGNFEKWGDFRVNQSSALAFVLSSLARDYINIVTIMTSVDIFTDIYHSENNVNLTSTGTFESLCKNLGFSGAASKLRRIYPQIQKDLDFTFNIFDILFECDLAGPEGIWLLAPANGPRDIYVTLSAAHIQIGSTQAPCKSVFVEYWTLCAPFFIPVSGLASRAGRTEQFFWVAASRIRRSKLYAPSITSIGARSKFDRLHLEFSEDNPLYANSVAKSAGARDSLRFGITLPHGVATIFGNSFVDNNCVKKWEEDDVFLDIGSGTGSVVSQIAYTIGIPSIGIECNQDFVELARQVDAKYRERGLESSAIPVIYCGDATSAAFESVYRAANVFYMTNTNFDTVPQVRGKHISSINVDGFDFFNVEHAILYRLAICLKRKPQDMKKRKHFLITTRPLGESKRRSASGKRSTEPEDFQLSFCVQGVIARLHNSTQGVAVNWSAAKESGWVYSLRIAE
tara:strand:+ start:684 stop:2087 length:1404 start_codon:yes stop_codon:yes gene_type:complete